MMTSEERLEEAVQEVDDAISKASDPSKMSMEDYGTLLERLAVRISFRQKALAEELAVEAEEGE